MVNFQGVGRVSKDVELTTKKTNKGDLAYCSLSVAFDNGKEEDATFLTFDCWGSNAENHAKYLEKGSLVNIEGKIKNNNYEKDGQKVYGFRFAPDRVEYLSKKQDVSKERDNDIPFR